MKEDEPAHAHARRTADAVARRSYGKLVAFLAAQTRDVAAAEDALSEAFTSALSDWPLHGCPSNPEAWLLTVARRRVIDVGRRRSTGEAATGQLQLLAEGLDAAAADAEIPDRRLALMFACAHPAIEAGVRAPLMLQVVVGLDAKTIASAFLMSPAAISKRLVRAKTKIRQAGIPFRVPERPLTGEAVPSINTTRSRSIVARVGTVGLLFFLVKGVLWLALPAWLYVTRFGVGPR